MQAHVRLGGGAEGANLQPETGSLLSTESEAGLNPKNHEIMTQAKTKGWNSTECSEPPRHDFIYFLKFFELIF